MSSEEQSKEWTQNGHALLFYTLARIVSYFNTDLSKKFYLWASKTCIYEQDYYGAAYMAEQAGEIKEAIEHYIAAGRKYKDIRFTAFYRAKRLAEKHGVTEPELPR